MSFSPAMDPNLGEFPILSFVLEKIPAEDPFTTDAEIESLAEPEPEFELTEKMPHLKNPKLVSSMRLAVSEIAQTRTVLRTIGARPDREVVDASRRRLSEIEAHPSRFSKLLHEDYKKCKAVINLYEMHVAYENMLCETEKRLEKIYEAAVAGVDLVDDRDKGENEIKEKEIMSMDVTGILKDAGLGEGVEVVDLSRKLLKMLPEAFWRMKSLVVLNLSSNQFEVIPESIGELENLEDLNLSANLLEKLPDSIGMLSKLRILDVSKNNLSSLPDTITGCTALEELDAGFNKLAYLPTEIGTDLVNLKSLLVHLNKIRSLPRSIGGLKSLRLLDAHFNQIRGLPPSIGRLANLEILILNSNFSDMTELPETISQLSNLKELDLGNNQIQALPDTFGYLTSLTKLNLEENPVVIPPKEVLDKGAQAAAGYMTRRLADILKEEQEKRRKRILEEQELAQAGLLTRSTSWLNSVATNVGGTVVDYLGTMGKTEADRHLDQQF